MARDDSEGVHHLHHMSDSLSWCQLQEVPDMCGVDTPLILKQRP